MNTMNREELEQFIDGRIELKMQALADMAATKALDKVYSQIGQSAVKKLAWIVVLLLYGLLSYMAGHGMKLPSL